MYEALTNAHSSVVAGEISDVGDENGSRVVIVDLDSMKVTKTYDWADAGGLRSCALADSHLICLETEPFNDGARQRLANHLIRIDLADGQKEELTTFNDDGQLVPTVGGRVYVATYSTVHLMSEDLSRAELQIPLTAREQQIETVVPNGQTIDVFVRDYNRTTTADGRAHVGRIVRLDPNTLKAVRQTPMQLPDQQLVGVHLIAHEFFA